jgi:hypothetical protein
MHVLIYTETSRGWVWACTSCDHVGRERYPLREHAQKAAHVHAWHQDPKR